MKLGSRRCFFSITYLLLIPEAFSTNSVDECSRAFMEPSLIKSLLSSLYLSTYSLNDCISSSFDTLCSGIHSPVLAICTSLIMKISPLLDKIYFIVL